MGYSSQVAVSFYKDDWYKEVYPRLRELEGAQNFDGIKISTSDVDNIMKHAERMEDDDIITFRWQEYKSWGLDPISKTIEKAAYEFEGDFYRCGDDVTDVEYNGNIGRDIQLQWPAVRMNNEPCTEQSDRIITALMMNCMKKGMSVGDLTKALKNVAGKEIVENFANKARQLAKDEAKAVSR